MKTGTFGLTAAGTRTRIGHAAIITTLAVAATLSSGCTHATKIRVKTEAKLQEHSRAFTTAVVDTLHAQPTERRDEFTELALQLAQQDQRVEGFPLDPLRVGDLLGIEKTNLPPEAAPAKQKVAQEQLNGRFNDAQRLLTRERQAENRLLAFGERFEEGRNEQRVRWFKRGTVLTLVASALAALVFFVPASVPVLGRILAWCVSRFPALAGTAGVVSVKAFDAVVKGIERMKSTAPFENQPHPFGNFSGTGPGLEELHLHLSREMDSAHKALVRKRKMALGLER
jgi:hypothetical protein